MGNDPPDEGMKMAGVSLEELTWTGRSCVSRTREASQGSMETGKRISSELENKARKPRGKRRKMQGDEGLS